MSSEQCKRCKTLVKTNELRDLETEARTVINDERIVIVDNFGDDNVVLTANGLVIEHDTESDRPFFQSIFCKDYGPKFEDRPISSDEDLRKVIKSERINLLELDIARQKMGEIAAQKQIILVD